MPLNLTLVAAALLAGLVLSGCGGGGGGSAMGQTSSAPLHIVSPITSNPALVTEASAPVTGTVTATEFAGHSGFEGQWGLRAIRAARAYENIARANAANGIQGIAPGAGVKIGFVDSGIDQEHPAFAGRTIEERFRRDGVDETGTGRYSHGTAVASAALGARIGGFPAHGVAWGANVSMFSIPLGSGGGGRPYTPITPEQLANVDIHERILFDDVLGRRDIDILNLSIGRTGVVESYSEADLRRSFSWTLPAITQEFEPEKTIIVRAAGNSHGSRCDNASPECRNGRVVASSPHVEPGLMARLPELRGHTIAVVAVREDGEITEFSNRCGIAADWCIAAPGQDVMVAWFGPHEGRDGVRGYTPRHGTSFAAPMVSGALAVMKSFFGGQLSNEELVTRVFATADKTGRYADRATYGQGMLDLGAATEPVGDVSNAAGESIGEGGFTLAETSLALGSAFGDGMARSLGTRLVMGLDELDAPFPVSLGGRVSSAGAASGVSLGSSLRALLDEPLAAASPVDDARRGEDWTPTSPLLHLAHVGGPGELPTMRWDGASGVSEAFFSTGRGSVAADANPALGMVFSWQASLRRSLSSLRFRAGGLVEDERLYGTSASGAFGRVSNRSVFAGVERGWAKFGSAWRFSASAEMGVASPEWEGALVADASPIMTSAFSLRAGRAASFGTKRGRLEWSLTQPLRVECADVTLSVPTMRTDTGKVNRQRWSLSATPSGRQLDFGMRWEQPVSQHGAFRLGATWTHEPGHIAGAAPDWSLLAGLRYAF